MMGYVMECAMVYGGLSFPGMGCPAPDIGYIYLVLKYYCNTVSAFTRLSGMFLSTDYIRAAGR